MEKFSLSDLKKKNYSDVYHYIYEQERSSKQSIANALQMSLPTVTAHLNDLQKDGLIETCGQLSSQIGRKAVAYQMIPEARISLGVEILEQKLTIAAVDLTGRITVKKNCPLSFSKVEPYFQQVGKEIRDFIADNEIEESTILGVGLALQGLVSQDGTEVIYGKILNCTGLSVNSYKKHLPYPCRLIHDSECAAMTFLWDANDISDALYLSLGSHLGGAVIMGGEIQSGRTGRSGTFEHMTLVPDGRRCYCGQKGCMECYCSAGSLVGEDEDLNTFFEKKNSGKPDYEERWTQYLGYLAMAINNLHMVIDSEVILGGHLAPYMTEEDLTAITAQLDKITAFPEKEQFLFLAHRKSNTIAIGAALNYTKKFLEGMDRWREGTDETGRK